MRAYIHIKYFFLIVTQPVIVGFSDNVTTVENENVSISCSSEANPVANVAWYFNHTQLIVSTNNVTDTSKYSINRNISDEHYGSITVYNVKYKDHGSYSCFVMNLEGNDSATSILTVQGLQ